MRVRFKLLNQLPVHFLLLSSCCYWSGRYVNHTNGVQNIALGAVLNERLGVNKYKGDELRSSYAAVDIPVGAEFLDDYNTFGDDPQWYEDILAEHGVSVAYMNPVSMAPDRDVPGCANS